MSASKPKVSIGMPVFNGDRYLRITLDSLLKQTYENVEIIISDNASTDETARICREYEIQDPRIRLVRQEKNVGAVDNFKKVLELASGDYFMWAAHDDMYLPDFVRRCVGLLEEDRDVELCYSSLRFIDEEGGFSSGYHGSYDNPDLSSRNVLTRLGKWWGQPGWYAIFGVYRIDAVREIPIKDIYGSDVVFLTDFLLKGFHGKKVNELLFHYRQYKSKTENDRYEVSVKTRKVIKYPHVDLYLSLFQSVLESDVCFIDKLLAVFILPWSLAAKIGRGTIVSIPRYFRAGRYSDGFKLLLAIPFLVLNKIKNVLMVIGR